MGEQSEGGYLGKVTTRFHTALQKGKDIVQAGKEKMRVTKEKLINPKRERSNAAIASSQEVVNMLLGKSDEDLQRLINNARRSGQVTPRQIRQFLNNPPEVVARNHQPTIAASIATQDNKFTSKDVTVVTGQSDANLLSIEYKWKPSEEEADFDIGLPYYLTLTVGQAPIHILYAVKPPKDLETSLRLHFAIQEQQPPGLRVKVDPEIHRNQITQITVMRVKENSSGDLTENRSSYYRFDEFDTSSNGIEFAAFVSNGNETLFEGESNYTPIKATH